MPGCCKDLGAALSSALLLLHTRLSGGTLVLVIILLCLGLLITSVPWLCQPCWALGLCPAEEDMAGPGIFPFLGLHSLLMLLPEPVGLFWVSWQGFTSHRIILSKWEWFNQMESHPWKHLILYGLPAVSFFPWLKEEFGFALSCVKCSQIIWAELLSHYSFPTAPVRGKWHEISSMR